MGMKWKGNGIEKIVCQQHDCDTVISAIGTTASNQDCRIALQSHLSKSLDVWKAIGRGRQTVIEHLWYLFHFLLCQQLSTFQSTPSHTPRVFACGFDWCASLDKRQITPDRSQTMIALVCRCSTKGTKCVKGVVYLLHTHAHKRLACTNVYSIFSPVILRLGFESNHFALTGTKLSIENDERFLTRLSPTVRFIFAFKMKINIFLV